MNALQANKGTINLNTGEGITAGILDVTGDMKVTDNKASVINVNMTKGSQWTGAVSNIPGSTYNAPAGQFHLTMAEGSVWHHETGRSVDTLKTTFAGSNVSKLDGSGVIYQNSDKGITVYNYSGDTTVIYGHDADNPQNITGGDFNVKTAAAGSKITLVTDSQGINTGFEANDTAAEKNNVKEVLNKLANKLFYTGYKDANLAGVVKIADGLTASSVSATVKASGDVTFSDGSNGTKTAGQGFYDYTPEQEKPNYKTGAITKSEDISLSRELDESGVAHVAVTESNVTSNFASAIYAGEETSPSSPMTVKMSGKGLALNAAQSSGQAAAIYAGANTYIKVINPSADQKLSIRATNTDTRGSHGIYALGNAHLNISGPVEITEVITKGDAATGINIQGQQSEINIDGSLTISNVKGLRERGAGMSAAGILVTGDSSTVTVSGPVDISGVRGSGIKLTGKDTKVSVGGGTITVAEDSDKSHNFYAVRVDKGTLDINMKDGAAGDTTTKITGDMYATGQYGKKVVEYTGGELINWKDAGILNVALTDKDSFWKGVAAYDQYNDDYGTGGNTAHDIGQINLWLQNGASWTNEVHGSAEKDWKGNSLFNGSHVTNFAGGASDAKAGNIFQKDSNALTIDSYSGNTNIFYAHTGNGEAASDYAAGDTIIKSAAEGSVVSMITDNTGVAMDNEYSVANVLNALAGKLTYSNFVNGEKNLTGYVKIADGLTASSKAMQTGNISFSTETGKGSLESGSMTPGITYPETQKPGSNKLNQGITGNAKDDYQLKMDGILKADGSYVFTQDPTVIEVKEGAAVNASASDIVIDTTKAKLELKGADAGINADGANVNIKGNTNISGTTGINAANGNVTLNGSTVINGTDAAINAGADANVVVNGNNSALTVNGSINADGGNITVDSGKATGTITGDINAANGGSVVINLTEKNSEMTGGYNVDGDSSIALGLANGATWHLTDGEEAAGMSLLRMAKGAADAGLTINGGKTEAEKGFLDMTERTKTLDIAHYSGWETVIYDHEGKGDKVEDYKSGDTVIAKADKGSGVILSTDGSGITMTDKNAVEATLKALAQKVTYKDHAANGENLSGKVQIAEGLTSSSVSKNLGTIHWDENGKGQYDLDSVNWNQIIEGDYETFVMKGVRSAATTSLHTWRDNMQDTYTGADMADEDGMFAKALGGKTSSDVSGLKDSNTYYGVQVGYDKAAANGWHTGVAFDYRNGDSNYLLGGKGDNQMYSLGVYGVKNFDNDAFFRVAAKVGRVENEYDVYNEIRSLKLNGDYKANAYGLTMEYGKTFGDEEAYFTPKAQLTWSQVGSKDYTAHTDNATMQISQDSYSSFVGRLGFEAGVKSEKGRVYAGLFAAHEFNGDISASYFANDGDRKHTSFDGEETWMEMKLGGTYDFSNNAHLYADIAKDFNGNFERKWKMNVGLRFEF